MRVSWQALTVPAAAVLAFGLSLAGSFHFDDYTLLTDPVVSAPTGWYEVFEPTHTRPLTYLTFWINHQAGGADPIGYHLLNLLLHATCAWMLWRCLTRVLPERPAWLAAMLFAVHPLQTEPVNYVFARPILLMTLFVLAAWHAWLRNRIWTVAAWFGAALLSKEECATFPLFLALFDWAQRRGWKRGPALGAMLLLVIAAGLRTVWAMRVLTVTGGTIGPAVTPWEYASMQGIAILRYFRLLLIPWGFTVDPDLGSPDLALRIVAWIPVLVLAGFALWRSRRERPWVWIAGGLLLLATSSSIFPVTDLAVDRRMYLPMIAFAAAIALVLEHRPAALSWAVVAVLTGISMHYSGIWKTEPSLWQQAVDQAPKKVRPKRQLARTMDPASARPLLEEAKGIAPEDPGVASDLGRVYLRLNDPARALAEFGREVALLPNDPSAIADRASALAALGDPATARLEYVRALKLDPCHANSLYAMRKLGEPRATPAGCRYSAEVRALLDSP